MDTNRSTPGNPAFRVVAGTDAPTTKLAPDWMGKGLAALQASLHVDQHARKDMIEFLYNEGFWDRASLSWDSAINRFNDCLNPGKPAFFKPAEVWALMKCFRRHQFFLAMAEDLGYEVRQKSTEERRQELLDRMASAVEGCERTLAAARSDLAALQAEEVASQHGSSYVHLAPRGF